MLSLIADRRTRESPMKPHVKQRVLVLSLVALFLIPILAKALCRCPFSRPSPPVDTRGWGLRQFVDYLTSNDLSFHVVPSREDGRWADNVYLTTDPYATWHDFQLRNQTPERLHQWAGSLWLHRIGPRTDVALQLQQWDGHGSRIDGFLLFGDRALVEQVEKLFPGSRKR